jgi:hypothetical protein
MSAKMMSPGLTVVLPKVTGTWLFFGSFLPVIPTGLGCVPNSDTRQILEAMRAEGAQIDTLVMSGWLARNALYLREHADATGCSVMVPDGKEPVLLGLAMLGAVAAGDLPDTKQRWR